MKKVVDLLISYYIANSTNNLSWSQKIVNDLTIHCLQNYLKFLNGGVTLK